MGPFSFRLKGQLLARLRDQLVIELSNIGGAHEATAWAHKKFCGPKTDSRCGRANHQRGFCAQEGTPA
jgi:hypothetical protein